MFSEISLYRYHLQLFFSYRDDYFDMFAPKCGGCGRAIMDNYISALNRQWHPECFICQVSTGLNLGNDSTTVNRNPCKGRLGRAGILLLVLKLVQPFMYFIYQVC